MNSEFKKLSNVQYFVMRIKPGGSLVEELKKFALKTKAGYIQFFIIGGGFEEVKCSFSVGGQKTDKLPDAPYISYVLNGSHEVSGVEGNISWHPDKDNEPMVHLHGVLGSNPELSPNKKPETYVAHLHEAKVRLTAEIALMTSDTRITRKYDKDRNLWLLDLSSQSATENTDTVSAKKNEFPWKIVVPMGIIIIWLLSITIFLMSSRKKV